MIKSFENCHFCWPKFVQIFVNHQEGMWRLSTCFHFGIAPIMGKTRATRLSLEEFQTCSLVQGDSKRQTFFSYLTEHKKNTCWNTCRESWECLALSLSCMPLKSAENGRVLSGADVPLWKHNIHLSPVLEKKSRKPMEMPFPQHQMWWPSRVGAELSWLFTSVFSGRRIAKVHHSWKRLPILWAWGKHKWKKHFMPSLSLSRAIKLCFYERGSKSLSNSKMHQMTREHLCQLIPAWAKVLHGVHKAQSRLWCQPL